MQIADAQLESGNPESAIGNRQSAFPNCRILLAEDDPTNHRLISFVLKKTGAQVTVVENGKEAAETALAAHDEGTPFDMILMDMQMPVMDGYEATRFLRSKGYSGAIVALTAHSMADDREKCIHAGCDDYATKPINRKELLEMTQRYAIKGGHFTSMGY